MQVDEAGEDQVATSCAIDNDPLVRVTYAIGPHTELFELACQSQHVECQVHS